MALAMGGGKAQQMRLCLFSSDAIPVEPLAEINAALFLGRTLHGEQWWPFHSCCSRAESCLANSFTTLVDVMTTILANAPRAAAWISGL